MGWDKTQIGLINLLWALLIPSGEIIAGRWEIWAFLPLSGPDADKGERVSVVYRLAQERSGEGSVWGLRILDHQSDTVKARSLALESIGKSEVIGWMGGGGGVAHTLATLADDHQIPYLIDLDYDDELTQGNSPWVFRLPPPLSEHNDGLVSWAVSVAGSSMRVAVLAPEEKEYAALKKDLWDDLQIRWTGPVQEFKYNPNGKEWINSIVEIKRFHPALVWFLGGIGDGARFLKSCRDVGYLPYAFLLGDKNLTSARMFSLSQGAAEWALGVSLGEPWEESEMGREFAHRFKALVGRKPTIEETFAYSAILVWSEVLNNGRISTRKDAQSGLREVEVITPAGLVKFNSYREFSNQNRMRTVAVQLQGEEWKIVWPRDKAEANYRYPAPTWQERAKMAEMRLRQNRQGIILLILTLLLLVLLYLRRKRVEQEIGS